MPWYRTGTVTVTNGSAIVTGAGTDFVGNVSIGEGFVAPDRGVYEVAQVISATQLQLATPYQGATAGGQGYSLLPTQSQMRDLALGAAQLLNTFGAVRDGIGQGLIADGSNALPGIRFAADQDTGFRRSNVNELGMVCGGIDRLLVNSAGLNVNGGIDVPPGAFIASNLADSFTVSGVQHAHYGLTLKTSVLGANPGVMLSGFGGIALAAGGLERLRVDIAGNLLVGVPNTAAFGGAHRIVKPGEGSTILSVDNGNSGSFYTTVFIGVSAGGYSTAAAAQWIGKHSVTGRSINSGGTINASGADYAEYMLKATGCGIIAKGDVCGVDRAGNLTKTWAEAISFVVKSTDPSLVGGDTWAAHLPGKPEQPGAEPIEPAAPLPPAPGADEAAIAAWRDARAAHPALLATYQIQHASWQQASDTYAADLAAWEDELETARQCVDRIAFCGQVPCNVTGEFDVGDYIIAAANGAGIKAIAVKPDAMTLPQYMRRIGKVWAIRDGRAWIDVQHG